MMNKFFVFVSIIMIGYFISGCATWHGAKRDTGRIWDVVTS